MEDKFVLWMLREQYYHRDLSSEWIDLAYDKLSIYSNISFIPYIKRMEAQSNSLSWAEQVKLNKLEEIILCNSQGRRK